MSKTFPASLCILKNTFFPALNNATAGADKVKIISFCSQEFKLPELVCMVSLVSITDIFSNMKCFIQEVENNSDKIVFISTIKLSNGNNLGVKSAEKIIRYLGFS